MKTIIKWVAGISFCMASLSAFITGGMGIFSGILFIVSGLICLPPFLGYVEAIFDSKLSSTVKYVIVIFCWLLGALLFPKDKAENGIINNNNRDKAQQQKDSSKNTQLSTIEYNKQIVEEKPSLRICKSDIGKVKTNGDGSIGVKTELTELLKLLRNKECDVIEIIFIQASPPDRNYEDMKLKLIYNKVSNRLQNIFTKTNVIEDYNNINEACLTDFLKSGKKNFNSLSDYCKDMKYDFNNRQMNQTAIGLKPEQSEIDASVKIVKDFIKSNAKNASSIKFLEWSKVSSFGENWVVRCKYKGTNSFGAIITENSWYYIQDSKVVDIRAIQ